MLGKVWALESNTPESGSWALAKGPKHTVSFSSLLCEGRVRHYSIFPDGSLVKNPSVNAGAEGSIPGLGRSLEKEMATHCSIFAWEIPWTEEPGGLQSKDLQKSWTQLGLKSWIQLLLFSWTK